MSLLSKLISFRVCMILKLKWGIFVHIESNIKPLLDLLIHHFNVVMHMVYHYWSSLHIIFMNLNFRISYNKQAIFMHNNLWNVWWLICTVYAFACNLLCSVMFISQLEITYSRVSHSRITLCLVILHLVMMPYYISWNDILSHCIALSYNTNSLEYIKNNITSSFITILSYL